MLTLDQIRAALRDRRPSAVARATGLHINTVRAVLHSPRANPTYRVLRALSDYVTRGNETNG